VLKGNHHADDRRPRPLRSLGTSVLVLSMAALLPSVLPGAAAAAATGAAVPVAGVLAFGIGAGQLGSPGGGSQSNSPTGVAFDGKGDLFAADPTNNRVVEYTPSSPTSYPRTGTVVAGTGGAGSGLNQLSGPNGVAVDTAGDLFVADSLNNRVVEYAYNAATGSYPASGKVVAGTGTAGSGLTQLSDPQGIALDASGDLFAADYGNNRVEEFGYNSATGSYASTATTVAGTGAAGSGTNQLAAPGSVALDAKGDLFIADAHNERVMEYAYNPSAGSYAASGTQIGGTLPSLAGWVTLDAGGDLFVSYGYLGSGSVLEFPYNSSAGSYASTGTAVASADQVGPSGLAFNPSGDLFAGETAQTNNPSQTVWDLVLEFTYNASSGTWSPTGTVMSQSGRMNTGVSSVAVDSHHNLFASDGPVYEFPYSAATGSYSPQGTQVAAAGSVLAVDHSNNLFVATTGTAGVLEYPWNASSGSYSGSGQAVPGATQLASLTVGAMAFDARNDLFVATSSQVLEFPYNASAGTWAASGTVIASVAAGGLALDPPGDLFVSSPSASRVREYLFNSATGAYATTGITVAGSGGSGSGANQLSGPTGVAVDPAGDLFVFDAGNARVMEFTTSNPTTGVYAANGTAVFTGSRDNYPETGGVALDSFGDVFFSYNYSSAVVYEATGSAGSPPPPAPAVTGVSPSTGQAAGGTAVTVSGTNLAGGSVTFGTAAATGVSCSAASCTATSPAGTGTINVTVTTAGGTSATSAADQFSYAAAPPPPGNLIPNPGFESAGVPADDWGSSVARSQTVVHSGSWSLAQTLRSSSGGWDLDSNSSWYAPISSAKSYTAGIWAYATATVRVNLSLDLLDSGGNYVDSDTGPNVTLTAGTWTHLTVTGIKPVSGEVYGGMEPDFLSGTSGTVIYWDDMTLTSP
jgi:sugar lactone lactonase YvrE